MRVVDSHLDLAWNAVHWNRDLKRPVAETRALERGMRGKARGLGTVALPEMRQGNVVLCFATVLARTSDRWREDTMLDTIVRDIAYARAQGQLAYYRLLERQGALRQIRTRRDLDAHLGAWGERGDAQPLGFVLAMEGADPILGPDDVPEWWDDGLRALSLAHYGVSAYAHGTGTQGGLLPAARPLLRALEQVGVTLDLTHLADRAFWEALDAFGGPIHASHQNCRALVSGQRQMTDDQLKAVIARDGVIGVAFDSWMLYEGWVKGVTTPDVVGVAAVIDHIDRVCQLAGNASHAALGTDLDGGFGKEQTPYDLDTIADLQHLPAMLAARGYPPVDIAKIMHGNWIRFLQRVLTNACPAPLQREDW
ncbi:MAG: membrane dipeptidase [Actinobacteria bacterium]|nr:membrane dipeptidase [Actinomycetota bacterium]